MTLVGDYVKTASELTGYRPEDWDVLQAEAEHLRQWGPEIVQQFYDRLLSCPEAASVVEEGERPKLERTLARWYEQMLTGRKDEDYWRYQWYIALMHIKRKTRNLYMLGMMNHVQQIFVQKCFAEFEPEKAQVLAGAFLRVSGIIATLIAECYDEVLESSTREGLAKVGINPALLNRIKDLQIKRMLEEFQPAEKATA